MSNFNDIISIINHFCEKYNISIKENSYDKFSLLTDELLKFNAHTNLTAVREPNEVAIKHIADSLSLLMTDFLPQNAKVIDVGCGAGFPGLPLKIARDDIDISFLDSTEKKLKFTSLVAEKLDFSAAILPMRAEDAAQQKPLREGFDVVVSRAMANLPVLLELCLPFVKVGGVFVAYKGEKSVDMSPDCELMRSKKAISTLGGKLEEIIKYDICDFYDSPDEDKKHCLIIVRKKESTNQICPRKYPKILKSPL